MFNGVKFFKQNETRVLVLSGGGRKSDSETETEVMKDLAIALGVSDDKIITGAKKQKIAKLADILGLNNIFFTASRLFLSVSWLISIFREKKK